MKENNVRAHDCDEKRHKTQHKHMAAVDCREDQRKSYIKTNLKKS